MNLLREYIRELLAEDAVGFVQDLTASEDLRSARSQTPRQGRVHIDKKSGKAIKRAFAKNADHQWLSTLNTVHWAPAPDSFENLIGKGKDEISTTMAAAGDALIPWHGDIKYGLWVKGRITVAASDMNVLFTGYHSHYDHPHEGSREEVQHRDRSSGRNKRPRVVAFNTLVGLDWMADRDDKEHEEIVNKAIPYVLNKDTWKQNRRNEALVDNWKPVGIVVADPEIADIVSGMGYITNAEEAEEELMGGILKTLILVAIKAGVSIYDEGKDILWSPK